MGPDVRWLELHRELRGKVETAGKVDVRSREDLAAVYFPGSMEPAKAIFRNPELSFQLTARGNSVARAIGARLACTIDTKRLLCLRLTN